MTHGHARGLRTLILAAGTAAGLALAASPALAQVAEAPSRTVPQSIDSGLVRTPASLARTAGPVVLFEQDVFAVESEWVQVQFGEVTLAGDPALGTGAFLTIESLLDGQVQRLNAETLAQWGNASAYFRGPGVRVRLWGTPVGPGGGDSRVSIRALNASIPHVPQNRWLNESGVARDDRSICDATDDRQPSTDNRSARVNRNCTAWLINDTNSNFLSAGHCRPSGTGSQIVEFNVPLSNASGTVQPAPVDDQFAVDTTSQQHTNGGVGNDWWYFGVFPHPNHGQMPFQRYGVRHTLATQAPAASSQPIRVTGYGTVASPISPTRNQTQQTHAGPYSGLTGTTLRYRPDTTGGNSGSPVIDESTGLAIGIHTHAGCTSTGGANQGSHIFGIAAFQNALNTPLGVCASGRGTPGGTLYAIGDRQNNFGTVQVAPNNFARIAQVGTSWQGLGYHTPSGVFYAINAAREIFTVSPAGEATLLGPIISNNPALANGLITGLTFDPVTQTWFATLPISGQLITIDMGTREATAVGPAGGGNIRALAFDALRRTLFGIEPTTPTTATLVRIDPATGARTTVGPLGLSNVVVGDIAVRGADATIVAINAAAGSVNGQLLRIDPASGAATVLGPTGGVFGSGYGLVDTSTPPAGPALTLDGAVVPADTTGNGNSNGRIDPGESDIRLPVAFRNVGLGAAEGVTVTLTSLSPTATVLAGAGSVSLGDIASGAAGGAGASPGGLAISVAREHPCGAPVQLRLEVTAAGVSTPWSFPLSLIVGQPGIIEAGRTFTWTGAVTIPDNSTTGATVLIPVSGLSGTIADVDVRFDGATCSTATTATTVGVQHPNVGDLNARVQSPDGVGINLFSRIGGTGNNICQMRLDDAAATGVQTLAAASNPYSGSFRPLESLAAFNGRSPNGVWQVRVEDVVAANLGTLRAVSVIITTRQDPVCQLPDGCVADFNDDRARTVQDVFDFLGAYFDAVPAADVNNSGDVTVQDVLDFVAAWFAGC